MLSDYAFFPPLLLPQGAIKVGPVDEVELGVGPVELLLVVVEGQSVRPVDVTVDDHLSTRAIHPSPLDLRDLTPVRPVHVPEDRQGTKCKPSRNLTLGPI